MSFKSFFRRGDVVHEAHSLVSEALAALHRIPEDLAKASEYFDNVIDDAEDSAKAFAERAAHATEAKARNSRIIEKIESLLQ